MSRSLWWGVAAAFILLSACSPAQHAPAGLPPWCSSSSRSARFVLAPSGSTPLSLTEVWRRGGLRKNEVLENPLPPSVGAGGWIAIPSRQLVRRRYAGTVIVVDTAGRWIGSVTKKGQGFGETMLPIATAWAADGTLSILDISDYRIVRLEPPDFHFVGQVKAPAKLLKESFMTGGPVSLFLNPRGRVGVQLLIPTQFPKVDTMEPSVFAVEAPGGAIDTLVSIRTATLWGLWAQWPAPGWATPMAASGPGGAIAVAGDVPQYRVRVLGSNLDDSLVICRDVASEPLTHTERGDTTLSPPLMDNLRPLLGALHGAVRPKVLAAMGRIFFGAEGQIWVQRARKDPLRMNWPPEGSSYDVYEPGGAYLGTVTAPPHAWLYGQIGMMVIGYEQGPDGEISVVAYRLGAASG